MEDAILQIILQARDEASATIKNLTSTLNDAEKGANIVSGAMMATGVAIAGVSIYSSKLASDFQQAMNLIQTNAGASTKEVQQMSKAVLEMAGTVGTAPEVLAQGLYHIESAGFRGAQALHLLRAAAEGAKVGNANLEDTTQALISLTASRIKGVKDETDAMGILNAIVGSGDMRMEALAQAMSTGIAPAAAAFGLSIQDVGAGLATLTDNAVPPIDAATRLRMTFSMMGAPSHLAAKSLGGIGLASTQLADDMRNGGLLKALQDLQKHLKDSGESASQQQVTLARAFGGGQESATILTLIQQMDRLKSKYTDIAEGAGKFGSAWDKTSANANMASQKLWASVQVLGIEFGNKLLPAITNVENYLASNLVPAVKNTVSWIDKNQDILKAIAETIATIVLPALAAYEVQVGVKNVIAVAKFIATEWKAIAAFIAKTIQIGIATAAFIIHTAITAGATLATGAMTVATWALNAALFVLTSPITLVVLAIVAVIAIGYLLITHWKQVQDVGKTVFNALGSFFTNLGNTIHGIVNAIIQDVKNMVNSIIDHIDNLIKGVNSVSSKVHLPAIPEIPHFASGTSNAPGGLSLVGENGPELVNLPRGSQVIPNSQVNNYSNRNANVTLGPVYVSNEMDVDTIVRRLSMRMKFNSAI
jgi:TP901 family phage tail tape measure protein